MDFMQHLTQIIADYGSFAFFPFMYINKNQLYSAADLRLSRLSSGQPDRLADWPPGR